MAHVIKPLTPETFPAWLALAEKHNGVWGGCYCSYFHGDTPTTSKAEYDGPAFKRRLVEEGVAHAALVLDGTRRSPGASTAAPRSCPGSTTASSTTRASRARRRGGSPASSSTGTTAARGWRSRRSAGPST